MTDTIKCYSDLARLTTFQKRYEYLRLNGAVGKETFGFDRYMNQAFYRSPEWRRVRDLVIARDEGCDLGISGREIPRGVKIIIHHMNPILPEDIEDRNDMILDPEFLITTIHDTHLAIHYGDEHMLLQEPVERFAGDTCPWRISKESSPPKQNFTFFVPKGSMHQK